MGRTDNKGAAELRTWEINSNSTRYDYLLAAPSDEVLTRYWTAWAVIATAGGIFVAVVLLGILSCRSTRRRVFNLFLVYLMIPDVVFGLLCGLVCALHAANGHQVTSVCDFQSVFVVWGVGSNMWLNVAVAYQLHSLMKDSGVRRKYTVPKPGSITRQAVGIYIFNLFLASWGLIESNKFPHYVGSVSGLACVPVEHDWKSSLFYWLAFFPLFGGIPLVYIAFVSLDIWKRNLMPPEGKRRLLIIFFGRIVLIFLGMWAPYMLTVFVFSTWVPTWVHFVGGTLSHLQGPVSASLCLLKPDIYFAVKRFVTCQFGRAEGRPPSAADSRDDHMPGDSMFSVPSHRSRLSARSWFSGSRRSPSSALSSAVPKESTASSHVQDRSHVELPDGSETAEEEPSDLNLWPDENGDYSVDEGQAPEVIKEESNEG